MTRPAAAPLRVRKRPGLLRTIARIGDQRCVVVGGRMGGFADGDDAVTLGFEERDLGLGQLATGRQVERHRIARRAVLMDFIMQVRPG